MTQKLLTCVLFITLLLTACTNHSPAALPHLDERGGNHIQPLQLGISSRPHKAEFSCTPGDLDAFQNFNPSAPNSVNLRSEDLSPLDLTNQREALLFATFDTHTQWPELLPPEFDYETVMKLGKNPGLNVSALHAAGITGAGIGVAVLDTPMLVEHREYSDRLKHYEHINYAKEGEKALMHGCAVSSIAVGETVGVAPEADLYYIAVKHGDNVNQEFIPNYNWTAKAIDRIIEINKLLPEGKKIRVVAIACGWEEFHAGYGEVMLAIDRAQDQGIFVVSASLGNSYNFVFLGLGRSAMDNPDLYKSYTPGIFWETQFWLPDKLNPVKLRYPNLEQLMVPMDSRTTASPTGEDDYVFYRDGGLSWSIPWIAGLYALACQVDPEITPDRFWQSALETGDTVELEKGNDTRNLGKIVNPSALIAQIGCNINE